MKIKLLIVFVLITSLLIGGCNKPGKNQVQLINSQNFQTTLDGKPVSLYTLKNANGMVVQITNYGGRVVALWVPDKAGNFSDVVLGYDSLQGYLSSHEIYYGPIIGRFGNRIANGKFSLEGTEYTLFRNNGKNTLHGGKKGFGNVVWDVKQFDDQTIELSYISKSMEEQFPGNLSVKVDYTLTNNNELKIEYFAETDKATPVNLTNHSFFNLHGAGTGTINDHLLEIIADNYTPVDSTLIPTGTIEKVEGTPFDFRKPVAIGDRLNDKSEQLTYGAGYDHNFVLNSTDSLHLACRVTEPQSGRVMEVITNEPGLQFYGGNFQKGLDKGKGGKPYNYRASFCLETQHFPDSPNQPDFPNTILKPGEKYYSICIYKFSVN